MKDGRVVALRMQAKGKLKFSTTIILNKEIDDLNADISSVANALWLLGFGDYAFKPKPTKGAILKALQASGIVDETLP